MTIKEVKASNYKSLAKVDLSGTDSFSKINMIYGYNNSGKSNLIKLLQLIFKKKYGGRSYKLEDGQTVLREEEGAANFWEGQLTKSPFMFTDNDDSKPIKIQVKFTERKSNLPEIEGIDYNEENEFLVKLMFEPEEYGLLNTTLVECSLNREKIYVLDAHNIASYFPDKALELQNEVSFSSLLSTFNDSVLFIDSDRYFNSENVLSPEEVQGLTPRNFKNWLFQLYMKPDKYSKFESILKSIKGFKLKASESKNHLLNNYKNFPLSKIDIGFSQLSNELGIMLNSVNRLPLENYGTGVQQIFYILCKIFESKPKVLLIEELELNLSPEYQKELLRFLSDSIGDDILDQLFFTSHSNYMANSTEIVKGFYAVSIDSTGHSSVTKLAPATAADYFDNPYIATS